jgi:hypothetical protein
MRCALAVVVLVGVEAVSNVASADRGDQGVSTPSSDKTAKGAGGEGATEEKPSPWRGSILLFDQSVTTQTLGVGADYQSYDPTYELWFALKPRYTYYQNENKTTSLAVALWANLYLELTNSDTTTTQREPLLGPTFVSTSLTQTLFERSDYKTSLTVGPRLTLPTDKESRNSGRYFGLGATAGLTQAVPLNGKDAPAFNGLSFGISSIYAHPFNRAIVPTTTQDDIVGLPRQTTAPRTVQVGDRLVPEFATGSDALRNAMNVKDSLSISFSGNAQLAPKMALGLSYVISNSWTYWAQPVNQIDIATGPAPVQSIDNPTNHRVGTWALASLDYDLIDEMSMSLGYYNQTNQIGPDGQRRNPLWSPDARFFFTLSGNLDVIAKDLAPHGAPAQTTASAK